MSTQLANDGCVHSYVLVRIGAAFGPTRDQVMLSLREHGIYAKRYFYPGCHRLAPYRNGADIARSAAAAADTIDGSGLAACSGASAPAACGARVGDPRGRPLTPAEHAQRARIRLR